MSDNMNTADDTSPEREEEVSSDDDMSGSDASVSDDSRVDTVNTDEPTPSTTDDESDDNLSDLGSDVVLDNEEATITDEEDLLGGLDIETTDDIEVREAAAALVRFAKDTGAALFLVGHVTKEGQLAGPRVLEHMVDAVLYFEGDGTGPYRVIRAMKNRFGAANELGIFVGRRLTWAPATGIVASLSAAGFI